MIFLLRDSMFNIVQLLHYRFSQEILSLELHSWNTCRPRVSRDLLGSRHFAKAQGPLPRTRQVIARRNRPKQKKHEPKWGIHLFKTPHATLCHFDTLPSWLALEWGQAPELKRTMFELARSTAAFSVVLWGRGQYQMWGLF